MNAWQPEKAVQIIAGTPPGGGLDRVARALAKAIGEAKLVNVPLEVINVPGGGARKAWTTVIDKHPGDGQRDRSGDGQQEGRGDQRERVG